MSTKVLNAHRFGCFSSVCVCVCIFVFVISNGELCVSGRAVFTVELYLQTERALIVGAETQETQHDWIQALTKVTHFAYSARTHAETSFTSLFFHLELPRRDCVNVPHNYSSSVRYFFPSLCVTDGSELPCCLCDFQRDKWSYHLFPPPQADRILW